MTMPSDMGTVGVDGLLIGYRAAKKSGAIVRCNHKGCAIDDMGDGVHECGRCGCRGALEQLGHALVAASKPGRGYYSAVSL